MTAKFRALLPFIFLFPVGLLVSAADDGGNAVALIDAYLAQAARSESAYRTDLKIGGDGRTADPGRLAGIGPFLGPFTYRPKTYAELTSEGRATLLQDSKFHAFLSRERHWPLTSGAGSEGILHVFSLPPDEMLRKRPFLITLDPP